MCLCFGDEFGPSDRCSGMSSSSSTFESFSRLCALLIKGTSECVGSLFDRSYFLSVVLISGGAGAFWSGMVRVIGVVYLGTFFSVRNLSLKHAGRTHV